MRIQSISLRGFRCFSHETFECDAPLVLVHGDNGTGKTSLLEALHFACYLGSFRTHKPRELLHFDHENFSIKLKGVLDHEPIDLTVAFAENKKRVLSAGKVFSSYREIFELYQAITVCEDDLMIIKGQPDTRRSFLNQAISLINHDYLLHLTHYRKVLRQRNALLAQGFFDRTLYDVWTDQLDAASEKLRTERELFLRQLQEKTHELITTYFGSTLEMQLRYTTKKKEDALFQKEKLYKRSLYGAHLDDFQLFFQDKRCKTFASRGQQKLVVFLLKLSHASLLQKTPVLLIDDFMTDFDEKTQHLFLDMFQNLANQVIITCPIKNNASIGFLKGASYQTIALYKNGVQ